MKKKGKSREGKPEPFSLSRYTYNTEQVYVWAEGKMRRVKSISIFVSLMLLAYSRGLAVWET